MAPSSQELEPPGNPARFSSNCGPDLQAVWHLTNFNNGTLTNTFFSPVIPTVCMDNHFQNQSNGNPIVIWECNNTPAQAWDWDGSSFHYHANPNKCVIIDWAHGGQLLLWDCLGVVNEKFVFTSTPSQ